MSEIFEFTPMGIQAHDGEGQGLGITQPAVGGAVVDAAKPKPKPEQSESPRPAGPTPPVVPPSPAPKFKLQRRQWVKELRARLKLIDRELKHLSTLEQERDEIKRLIHAATNRPANVTQLRRSG